MGGVEADVHAEVSVEGDVLGQLAIGNNILQIGSLHGDLVTVAQPGSIPNPVLRPPPVKVVPRRPDPFFGQRAESALLLAEARAGHAVAVEGSPGVGRSTLLRRVATDDALQSVAFLSEMRLSLDDAAQVLFDHFYHCDLPLRPTPAQARLLLQQVRATIVVDDIATDTARGLIDLAPNCGFVLATSSPVAGVRSLTVGGLAADEARALFEHSLGRALRPDEQSDADRLCMFAGNSPSRIVATAAMARASDQSLGELAEEVWASGASPDLQPTDADARLIDLLAAIPGLIMPESWLSELSHAPDVALRLRRWVTSGLVREFPDAGYQLVGSRTAPGDAREAVISHAVDIGRTQRGHIRRPCPMTDALQAVLADCTHHADWQAVLDIGAVLDPVYAQSGRWDAWRDVLAPMLNAARAVGNRAAEARALHQLGTRELCLLGTAAAGLLAVALRIREMIGDTAGAAATRHNISQIPPAPAPDVGHEPPPQTHSRPRLKAAAAAATALWTTVTIFVAIYLTYSTPSVSFATARLVFPDQPISTSGATQVATLVNNGQTTAHITMPRTVGTNAADFEVTATTCTAELPVGQPCDTTVAFIPTAEGTRTASLAVDVAEGGVVASASLAGTGSAPTGLIVNPPTLYFPEQAIGTAGQSQTITVTRRDPGTTMLGQTIVDGGAATAFGLVNDTCSGQVLTNAGPCTVDVQFVPKGPGPQVAHVQFVADNGSVAAGVSLQGAGVPRPVTQPGPRSQVIVPQVVGKPIGTARVMLAAAGLRVGAVSDAPDDSTPAGQVVRSGPAPGTQVESGTAVDLVTSSGPPTCVVPDVAGQDLESAKSAIAATCAVVGAVTTKLTSESPANVVIRTVPPAGAEVTKGGAVRLVISKEGKRVPNVVGSYRGAAEDAIQGAGLSVGTITPADPSEARVIASSPAAGTPVEPGSNVNLTFEDLAPEPEG